MKKQFKVSIVKCVSYNNSEINKALIESLNNIDFELKKGMKILIKPNLLSPSPPEKAITTHPVVIEELCKILKKYDSEIYIGDSSSYNTNQALEVCGIKKLSKYAKILNFEDQPKKFFDIEKNKIPLPEIIFKVDLIINLAKLKTHAVTKVTLCVKNLYGCIPGKLKQNLHRTILNIKDFNLFLLKLHETISPQLNIIDGVLGLEGEGPGSLGNPIDSKVIIMGRDARAVDIVASELMGFRSEDIFTNKLSKINKKEIEVDGNGKDIKLKFKKPSTHIIRFLFPIARIFPKPKIKFNNKKCNRCLICEENCPVKAIKINPLQKCDHKKCINCLCCTEMCPNGAVYLQEHWTKRTIKNMIQKLKNNKKT